MTMAYASGVEPRAQISYFRTLPQRAKHTAGSRPKSDPAEITRRQGGKTETGSKTSSPRKGSLNLRLPAR